jgi:flagellar basal-body rod protein FlgB
MSDSILLDDALRAGQIGLDGLARRQEVIGRNLANVDTPGFRAQALNFENALSQALQGANQVQMNVTNPGHLAGGGSGRIFLLEPRQGGSARADGNNVDIDVELSQMAETGIRYQALAQSVSKKLLLLKNIASGR